MPKATLFRRRESGLDLGKDFVDRYPKFCFNISLRLAQMLTDFRVNFGRNPACGRWLKRHKILDIFQSNADDTIQTAHCAYSCTPNPDVPGDAGTEGPLLSAPVSKETTPPHTQRLCN